MSVFIDNSINQNYNNSNYWYKIPQSYGSNLFYTPSNTCSMSSIKSRLINKEDIKEDIKEDNKEDNKEVNKEVNNVVLNKEVNKEEDKSLTKSLKRTKNISLSSFYKKTDFIVKDCMFYTPFPSSPSSPLQVKTINKE